LESKKIEYSAEKRERKVEEDTKEERKEQLNENIKYFAHGSREHLISNDKRDSPPHETFSEPMMMRFINNTSKQ
jgi:hypothetical protein